jgi:excisionase family DNA binding protein
MLTVAQVAERLGVDESTVRRRIAQGKLQAYKVGGIRIKPEDVAEYLERSRVVTCQPETKVAKPKPKTARITSDWEAELEARYGPLTRRPSS